MLLSRLTVLLKYYIFWLLFFALSRSVFLVYNFQFTDGIPFFEVFLSFIKGLKLDLSMGGYIVFIASLVFAFTFFLSEQTLKKVLNGYTLVILIVLSIITISDCELYRNWGFRIDSTVLLYIKTPKDAMASTTLWLTIVLVLLMVALTIISYWFYRKYVVGTFNSKMKASWWSIPVFIFVCGLVFIPIRGSLGIAPINTGAVYFSNHSFANHLAVNTHWHLGHSLLYIDKTKQTKLISQEESEVIFDGIQKQEWDSSKFTSVEHPNIVIVILESFSSRIVEPLGGIKGVTPNLNKLTKEGILYSNCFANGDRSDKGIVCILSGYPAQPKTSIIKNTAKAEKLPFLTHELNNVGYNTSFYYGGDINFANMRSYLVSSKFNNITSLDDFDAKDRNSKWGIHDHVVFNKLYEDCNIESKPFFKAFFTLSSHEPFDVPLKGPFSDETEESRYLNSAYYTDSCLGDFVTKAKTQTWWDSTLVIFVPDHGGRWPGNVNYSSRIKFEIPLLIIGGALNVSDTIIDSYVNQSDIVKVIGRQLNNQFTNFRFSKNRTDSLQSYAFYAFNNGFGYFTKTGGFVFDITSEQEIYKEANTSDSLVKQGKAYLQTVLSDYNTK